jgi:translation initiation factor IF-2
VSEQNKITIPEAITVREFAGKLNIPVSKIIAELMKNGIMATINESIDFETAQIVGDYLGFEIEKEERITAKQVINAKISEAKKLIERPPIVVVMGHVDHGKTSLLDAIREAGVALKEAGGITQHIGAYQVEKNSKKITFLDTPGHAAFESMRAHGAEATDIAIIVIAANDGVKPQTLEAINHAKKANVPMIIAINKMDLPEANIDRAKQQLTEIGLIPEDWGGDTITIPVSAKTKDGIEDLLEMILLIAEMKNYKADPLDEATGLVIESHVALGKGPMATILIKNGTLRIGDFIQAGSTYGKVRLMEDYKGKKIKEALPSTPVRISGLKELPSVADIVQVFAEEKVAREEASVFARTQGAKKIGDIKKLSFEDLAASYEAGKTKELKIVLKADVKGSLDTIIQSLDKFKTPEVQVKVINEGIGSISESDIMMAAASKATVIGFGVSINATVNQLARREKVNVHLYKVIYELLDDIKEALENLLPPVLNEVEVGKMEILKVFKISKGLVIAGGKVTSGKMTKNIQAKIFRGKEEVGKGKLVMVKREKDEVSECSIGMECGVSIETGIKLEEKDVVLTYTIEKVKRYL